MSKRKAEQSNAAASKMLDDVEAFGDWGKDNIVVLDVGASLWGTGLP